MTRHFPLNFRALDKPATLPPTDKSPVLAVAIAAIGVLVMYGALAMVPSSTSKPAVPTAAAATADGDCPSYVQDCPAYRTAQKALHSTQPQIAAIPIAAPTQTPLDALCALKKQGDAVLSQIDKEQYHGTTSLAREVNEPTFHAQRDQVRRDFAANAAPLLAKGGIAFQLHRAQILPDSYSLVDSSRLYTTPADIQDLREQQEPYHGGLDLELRTKCGFDADALIVPSPQVTQQLASVHEGATITVTAQLDRGMNYPLLNVTSITLPDNSTIATQPVRTAYKKMIDLNHD